MSALNQIAQVNICNSHQHIQDTFNEYPPIYKKKLILLRKLIIQVSKNIKQGPLVETHKWGQPSYLLEKNNIGTTIRLHWLRSKPDQCGIYFPCSTDLIKQFKAEFGDKFNYENQRAIVFKKDDLIPEKDIKKGIELALTYHLNKK